MTPANSETFGYTPSHRLSSASGAYGSLAWTYDSDGARTSETAGSTARSYAYPPGSNRLSGVSQGGSTVRSFGYDAAGNQTSDVAGSTSITRGFDGRGRLASIVNGSTTAGSYSYDGFDRLTQRVTASGTTQYYYDPLGRLVLETDQNGNSLREYVWLYAMPIGVIDDTAAGGPTLYYVHADHLNRPVEITDASGAAVWTAVWSPFGAAVSIAGSLTYDARFPGQWFQLEDDLHWNLHRHYDPSTGRYIQVDPLSGPTADDPSLDPNTGAAAADTTADVIPALLASLAIGPAPNAVFPDGPSRYGYVGGSPLVRVDPSGTQEILISGRLPPIIEQLLRLGRITPDELKLPKEVIPRQAGKVAADDIPSWCRGERPTIQESGKDFAERLMDQKYGPGNYQKGPGSEFSKIQKWGDRNFRVPEAISSRLTL